MWHHWSEIASKCGTSYDGTSYDGFSYDGTSYDSMLVRIDTAAPAEGAKRGGSHREQAPASAYTKLWHKLWRNNAGIVTLGYVKESVPGAVND